MKNNKVTNKEGAEDVLVGAEFTQSVEDLKKELSQIKQVIGIYFFSLFTVVNGIHQCIDTYLDSVKISHIQSVKDANDILVNRYKNVVKVPEHKAEKIKKGELIPNSLEELDNTNSKDRSMQVAIMMIIMGISLLVLSCVLFRKAYKSPL